MIIAIPVDENRPETAVCPSFGRAPYYLLADTKTGAREFLQNTAAGAPGGAGTKAAQLVVDAGTEVLLSPRMGQNAADVIVAAGIKIFRTTEGTAEENLEAQLAGKLEAMTQFHPGYHHRP